MRLQPFNLSPPCVTFWLGEFVAKELLALIELHKYRAMKNRYPGGST